MRCTLLIRRFGGDLLGCLDKALLSSALFQPRLLRLRLLIRRPICSGLRLSTIPNGLALGFGVIQCLTHFTARMWSLLIIRPINRLLFRQLVQPYWIRLANRLLFWDIVREALCPR